MKILVTNDDGYQAKGIQALVRVLRNYGDLTVVAPKTHQSGMSMAVSMGLKPIAVKQLSDDAHERWWYLDGTPASCVKFGVDNIFTDGKPDLVVSGINHGNNAATAALYSGTLGAAMEGAVNRIPAIGVSLDNMRNDADFTVVEQLLPGILDKLIPNMSGKYGQFYNINFPNLPAEEIKGVKLACMGRAHWEKEYRPYSLGYFEQFGIPESQFHKDAVAGAEPGEEIYVMVGDFTDEADNKYNADHRVMADGYISISAHNIDNSDYDEIDRLAALGLKF